MEFFNIGAPELLVIVLIGLLLFGPEDLVKFVRTINGYLHSAQRLWREVSSQLEFDLTQPDAETPPRRSPLHADAAEMPAPKDTAPDESRET